ncbi:MAG: lysozyme [Pseudomonadota bacterium]
MKLLRTVLFCAALNLPSTSIADSHGPEIERVPAQSLIEDLIVGFSAPAPAESERPLLPLGLALIKHFEGWFPSLYDDPAGYCTIGYGHLIAKALCRNTDTSEFNNGLTKKQGETLLLKDTGSARRGVQSLVTVELNAAQFGALTSFVFNVGRGNFASSTLLKHLNRGDYDGAAGQFHRWVRAGNKVLPGLQRRRGCEAALFNGALDFGADGTFDAARCVQLGAVPTDADLIDITVGEGN